VGQAIVPGNRAWQSCLQPPFRRLRRPFRPPSNRPLTQFAGISSASCFAGIPQRSLRNSSRIGNGGLKGRLQARLPATRMAKVEEPPERRLQAGLPAPLSLSTDCHVQTPQPPFRRLANPEHWRSQRFFGFVFCRYRDGKPEKFVKGRASRLKAGCSQD